MGSLHRNLRPGLGRRLAAGWPWCLLAMLLPMLVLLAGCEDKASQPAFVVHNRSGESLRHLVIVDAGPVLNYPKLGDGDIKTRKIPGDRELPKVVNVYWEDLEGKSHHQRVELWKRINSNYQGPIKLTLERSGSIRVSKTSSI